MHVVGDRGVGVMASHELIDKIERDFAQHTDVTLVIHMDPIIVGDPVVDKYRGEVRDIVHGLDKRYGVHDFRMPKGPKVVNLIFDVAVTFDCKMTDDELTEYIQTEMDKLHDGVFVVPTFDRQSCEYTEEES